jgi:hypothetical protein
VYRPGYCVEGKDGEELVRVIGVAEQETAVAAMVSPEVRALAYDDLLTPVGV